MKTKTKWITGITTGVIAAGAAVGITVPLIMENNKSVENTITFFQDENYKVEGKFISNHSIEDILYSNYNKDNYFYNFEGTIVNNNTVYNIDNVSKFEQKKINSVGQVESDIDISISEYSSKGARNSSVSNRIKTEQKISDNAQSYINSSIKVVNGVGFEKENDNWVENTNVVSMLTDESIKAKALYIVDTIDDNFDKFTPIQGLAGESMLSRQVVENSEGQLTFDGQGFTTLEDENGQSDFNSFYNGEWFGEIGITKQNRVDNVDLGKTWISEYNYEYIMYFEDQFGRDYELLLSDWNFYKSDTPTNTTRNFMAYMWESGSQVDNTTQGAFIEIEMNHSGEITRNGAMWDTVEGWTGKYEDIYSILIDNNGFKNTWNEWASYFYGIE